MVKHVPSVTKVSPSCVSLSDHGEHEGGEARMMLIVMMVTVMAMKAMTMMKTMMIIKTMLVCNSGSAPCPPYSVAPILCWL